jgi:hypothetical protein
LAALIGTYDLGDGIRATATFKNLSKQLADPSAVTCQVKDPSGTITTPSPTQDSTGVYRVDITLDVVGDWHIRFAGTGNVIAAVERRVKVLESEFD